MRKPSGKPKINVEAENIALAQDELKRVLDVKWWRWRHLFLRARGLQIRQRQEDGGNHQPTIDGILAEVPDEDRAVFERYYQAALDAAIQRANRQVRDMPANPDAVEAELAEQLTREAEGRDHPQGLGSVPSGDGEYEIVPPETDPRTAQPRGKGRSRKGASGGETGGEMTPARWATIGVVALLPLLWLIWSVAGSASPAAAGATASPGVEASAATPTPLQDVGGSGEDVTVFYPASLEIARPRASAVVYPVVASASDLGGTWQPQTASGTAAWLNGTYINLVFCLPAESEAMLKELSRGDQITMRPASGALRHYAIIRTRSVGRQQIEIMDQRRAGLTLIACGIGNNERTVAEAMYQAEASGAAPLSSGAVGELPNLARLTIKATRSRPPAAGDPPGYSVAEVDVQIDNLSAIDLQETDLIDQLAIAGAIAERLAPSNARIDASSSRVVTYRYRVPQDGGGATWQATAASGETVQMRLTIGAAAAEPGRAGFTSSIIQADIRLRHEGDRDLLLIPIIITAQTEVELSGADFSLWVGEREVALTAQTPLPFTVEAGDQRTLVVAGQIPDVSMVELEIGRQRWRLSLP
jgi:hypothetical protein